ncbi:MAG: DUF2069 domain-containing protein [Gammaproteobacteria bacterium]
MRENTTSSTHYRALMVSFLAFPLIFFTGFCLLYTPQTRTSWLLALVQLLPWLACAPLLVKRHRMGLLWFTLLALFYLLASLSQIAAPWPRRGWLLADAFLISYCLTSALLYLRASQRKQHKQCKQHKQREQQANMLQATAQAQSTKTKSTIAPAEPARTSPTLLVTDIP